MRSFLAGFQSVGAELRRDRLVTACGGNLSIRVDDRLVVTRHGSSLGRLRAGDLVETGFEPGDPADSQASMELSVHRAIYHLTLARAVVHAHPPHAIAISLDSGEILPQDVEGSAVLGRVPIVGQGTKIGPGQGAEDIAAAFQDRPLVIVRGHGCFAIGNDLDEAYGLVSTLEESCRILCLLRSMGR